MPNRSASSSCARSDSEPGASYLARDSPLTVPAASTPSTTVAEQGQDHHQAAAPYQQVSRAGAAAARRGATGGAWVRTVILIIPESR